MSKVIALMGSPRSSGDTSLLSGKAIREICEFVGMEFAVMLGTCNAENRQVAGDPEIQASAREIGRKI